LCKEAGKKNDWKRPQRNKEKGRLVPKKKPHGPGKTTNQANRGTNSNVEMMKAHKAK